MALVVVSAGVEPEQREELERRARQDDRPISFFVRRALSEYLEREKPSTRAPSDAQENAEQ